MQRSSCLEADFYKMVPTLMCLRQCSRNAQKANQYWHKSYHYCPSHRNTNVYDTGKYPPRMKPDSLCGGYVASRVICLWLIIRCTRLGAHKPTWVSCFFCHVLLMLISVLYFWWYCQYSTFFQQLNCLIVFPDHFMLMGSDTLWPWSSLPRQWPMSWWSETLMTLSEKDMKNTWLGLPWINNEFIHANTDEMIRYTLTNSFLGPSEWSELLCFLHWVWFICRYMQTHIQMLFAYMCISMGWCRKDVAPARLHWICVFLALTIDVHVQCGAILTRSIFSRILTTRMRYGVSVAILKFDLRSVAVIDVPTVVSCKLDCVMVALDYIYTMLYVEYLDITIVQYVAGIMNVLWDSCKLLPVRYANKLDLNLILKNFSSIG